VYGCTVSEGDAVMLERWQVKKIQDKVGPMLNYLGRLKTRMEKTGRQNGKLYVVVSKAHDAVHALSVDLHYLSCPGGVYREPEE
jgi:hypothetical protein